MRLPLPLPYTITINSINFSTPRGNQEETMNSALNKKSGKGVSHGVVSELSTFFTVRPGHEEAIRAACERFNQWLYEMGPDVHRKTGLREWRQVIFDNGQRLMLITSFET